eukprot:TRINITY_DN76723_c0_g1_i1.p2 TRINITY_DN76723_c0_g1~~TRINITY_DN76723_c0_g1_i1.p2  ORF type:complete len:103 (+),score=4.75 TRINITY_DN76723_c0_g1_i1:115-423(+)
MRPASISLWVLFVLCWLLLICPVGCFVVHEQDKTTIIVDVEIRGNLIVEGDFVADFQQMPEFQNFTTLETRYESLTSHVPFDELLHDINLLAHRMVPTENNN